jgi:hypothetical protein
MGGRGKKRKVRDKTISAQRRVWGGERQREGRTVAGGNRGGEERNGRDKEGGRERVERVEEKGGYINVRRGRKGRRRNGECLQNRERSDNDEVKG